MDRGAWWAAVHGDAKSRIRLSRSGTHALGRNPHSSWQEDDRACLGQVMKFYSAPSHRLSCSGIVTWRSTLLMHVSSFSTVGITQNLLWGGGWGDWWGQPPSQFQGWSKFVLFSFRFNVSLLHCTRLLTRGRPSHASSPLHAAADWPFEVLLGLPVGIHVLEDSAFWNPVQAL